MAQPYTRPELNKSSFHCAHCSAFSSQHWTDACYSGRGGFISLPSLRVSLCQHCGKFALWLGPVPIYPSILTAPSAHDDMPAAVRADYEEARIIAAPSPRGAAALLRLAIQRL